MLCAMMRKVKSFIEKLYRDIPVKSEYSWFITPLCVLSCYMGRQLFEEAAEHSYSLAKGAEM
jgi:hypothetical protein